MDRVEYNSGSNWASNFKIGRNYEARLFPELYNTEVQLLINRNYNKMQEEYDSGINYLTGWYIQLLSLMMKKKPFKCN